MPKKLKVKFFRGLKVVDAKRDATLTITQRDIRTASAKDPANCAAALACKRQFHTAEALVFLSRAYIRTGNSWRRFITADSMRREVVAIDRGGKFEAGTYVLQAPSPTLRLGYYKPTGPKRATGKRRRPQHATVNVRARPLAMVGGV